MEIQGGMRLTPLGLRQLGGVANQVVNSTGAPPAQPDPGTGNTTVIDPSTTAPLQTTAISISIPSQAYTGNGTYNLTLADYGFSVGGITYLAIDAGHGSANDVQLFNGVAGTKFATVDTISAVALTQVDASKIKFDAPASAVVAKGGVISVVVRGGGSGKTAGVLTLHGVVMP